MSDKLCRENGLSVVVPGKGSKGKSYAEYQAEKTGTSWKGKLKIAVDTLIPQVASFEELLQLSLIHIFVKLLSGHSDNLDSGFIIQNGVKFLIKRKRFEDFLNDLTAI